MTPIETLDRLDDTDGLPAGWALTFVEARRSLVNDSRDLRAKQAKLDAIAAKCREWKNEYHLPASTLARAVLLIIDEVTAKG